MKTAIADVKKLLQQCEDCVKNVSKMSYPCEVFVKARKLEFGRQCGKVRLIGCPHLGPMDPKNGGI